MTTAQHGGASVADGVGNNTTGAVYSSEYLRQWTPSLVPGESNENSTKPHHSHNSPSPFHEPPKIVFAMAQPSGVTEEGLIKSLKEKIGATHVDIEDMSGGCGQAFSAIIVSPQFEKKTTLARHRMVNTALKQEVAAIHAWTPKCYTPEQWEVQRVKGGEGSAPQAEKADGTTA